MKLPALALSLLCLAACGAPPRAPSKPASNSTPASIPGEIDLEPYAGREMSVVDFLHTCQQVSGFNFTYTEATGEALNASSLRLPATTHVTASEFQQYLEVRLSAAGFVCRRVGPENLRVYVVERRTT